MSDPLQQRADKAYADDRQLEQPTLTATINCDEYEYKAEPTDGVTLNDGKAWWGTSVRYRKTGSRNWNRFTLVDVHSWDKEAIVAAIDWQAAP